MDMEELLIKLYSANEYSEVYKIVHKNKLLSDYKNWQPYGGNKNNFGTFENQQARAEAALVEKITNSIDAILIKECLLRGIDPKDKKSAKVPENMCVAIEKFFNVTKGKWESVGSDKRREIATNLQVIVSGDKVTPSVTIYDNGEGQNPDKFEDTFLSLQQGNKTDIPFVQGKYNMGSTGAVLFCGGAERYQLIISRRCQKLGDSNGKIGFTLVRKHPLSEEEDKNLKSTWYEYFAVDGKIPAFTCKELDLKLSGRKFEYGSIVKLYSYELSRGCKSDATLDLWRELNALLYESILPVLIYETRFTKGHSNTKLMLGNKTRISIDDTDKKYIPTLSYSIKNADVFGAEIPIEVTVFKSDIKSNEFIRNRPVIYVINGQTQGSENGSFISQDLALRELKDKILISVDCTNTRTQVRGDLFMASRDRLREGDIADVLRDEIIKLLKNDETLKRINQEYKGKILHESKNDKELIEGLFSKLKGNKEIRNLLGGNKGFFNFNDKSEKSPSEPNVKGKPELTKNLKRFPAVFKVEGIKEQDGKKYKAIPKGGRGIIKLETDVCNEFLTRNLDKGELEISILDYGEKPHVSGPNTILPSVVKDKLKVSRSGPYDGEIKLIIEPDNSVAVGDVFELSAKLISAAGTIEEIIFVKIEQEKKNINNVQPKKEPELNLPKAIRVFEKKDEGEDAATWSECGMTAVDVVKFQLGENNELEEIRVNMDANLVKKEINKKQVNVENFNKKYFAYIYAHALVLYSLFDSYYSMQFKKEEIKKEDMDERQDQLDKMLETAFVPYGGFLMDFDTDFE